MSTGGSLHSLPPIVQALPLPPAKSRRRTNGVVLAEQEMIEPVAYEAGCGTAVVFSARSPAKSTPNEDVAAVVPTGPEGVVLIVADGLGGHVGGEQASRLTVETLRMALKEVSADEGGNNGDQVRSAILNGIEQANRGVLELGTGAATTLALVEIQGNVIRPYHVGDSAILVTGGRGKLKLQTIPHSPVGYAVESGMLDEQDAMHHEDRHVISNMIGSSEMRIEIGPPLELAARDTVLLASDGLFDNLLPDEIVEIVRRGPLARAARRLADAALLRMTGEGGSAPSKPDDLTLVVFRPK